ncbi:MAG: hypothetical protein AAB966_00755 [Patescibacteria group bacterium]
MSKKVMSIVLVLIVLGLLGGGYYFMNQNKPSGNAESTGNTDQQVEESSNPLTSFKDALLSKTASMTCSFKNEKGQETKMYIKAGAVRMMMTGLGASDYSNTLTKDTKMYMWSDVKKTGIMYSIDINAMKDQAEKVEVDNPKTQPANTDELAKTYEKYKNSCKTGIVDDSLFAVPTNVKFQDMSVVMENVQNQMKDFKLPAGVTIPSSQ